MNPAPSDSASKQPPPRRRPQSTNPLVTKRRPPPKNKPAPRPIVPSQQTPTQQNGTLPKQQAAPIQGRDSNAARAPAEFAQARRSPTPEGKPTIFKVKMSKRALLDNLRYHVVRMQSKENVNILDESQYTRPIKLYRRDPAAQLAGGAAAAASPADTDVKVQIADEAQEKERERMEAIKAERQRIKEENLKQIAPAASKKRLNAFKKKTEQVYRTNETAEEVKRSQLRYEESLPWHLEDFDNKHTWVGAYEATLSDSYVMLVLESDHFRIVPLEKWYRFKERGNFKHISSEEAEALMKKKAKEPRWLLLQRQKEQEKKVFEKESTRSTGLFVRSGEKDAGEGVEVRLDDEDGLGDELDFDDKDLFDDDDGDQIIGGEDEDEKKDAENKIKREQLNANIFDMKDEKEVDDEEDKKEEFEKEQKKSEKSTRKALMQHERNFDYEDWDEENPYSSESEREDSGDESAAPSEQPQAPGSAGKSSQPKVSNGGGSGASTIGENTPSGRKKAGADALLQRTGLKRPGSPDLSEASGNESAVHRKKTKLDSGPSGVSASKLAAKLKAGEDLSGASGTESSRKKDPRQKKPTAKGAPNRSLGASSRIGGAGSGSDSESLMKTSKLAQRGGQPPRDSRSGRARPAHESRAASPSTGSQGPVGKISSRAGSPSIAPVGSLPSEAEIIAAIPPGGIDLSILIKEFQSRVPKDGRQQFIALVRRISHFDKETKKLFRKKD